MLTAAGTLDLQHATLATMIAVDRAFTLVSVERRGTVYNTRYIPPARAAVADVTYLYLVLEGTFEWDGGLCCTGPGLFMASMETFEGAKGLRASTYRSFGEPFRALELRVQADAAPALSAPAPQSLSLSPAVLAAAENYSVLMRSPHVARDRVHYAHAFLESLRAAGILRCDVTSAGTFGKLFEALWGGLGPTLENLAFSTTRDELSHQGSLSRHRVQAQLSLFARAINLPWVGWREATLRFRIRLAVLFLSNPAIAISDIARTLGYLSPEALNHSFLAEGLASPSEVRAALLRSLDG